MSEIEELALAGFVINVSSEGYTEYERTGLDTKKLCDEIVKHMNEAAAPGPIHFEKDEFGTVQLNHDYEIERAFTVEGPMTDWRCKVPEHIKECWHTFDFAQMIALRKHFDDLLKAEQASWFKE